ncbi:hypothetical protein ANN_11055 [Periplaneta americana]|uniref:Uncharacterized protein n=1 Tax=Periplaneta americana TaxID=6978 RepID=A0ABQ8T3Z0_PERAM|nr:hypothetical protein ANN_11055 [Periplaneta americana]
MGVHKNAEHESGYFEDEEDDEEVSRRVIYENNIREAVGDKKEDPNGIAEMTYCESLAQSGNKIDEPGEFNLPTLAQRCITYVPEKLPRKTPEKNLNQVTCPDRESNPGHLVSRPDALADTTIELEVLIS